MALRPSTRRSVDAVTRNAASIRGHYLAFWALHGRTRERLQITRGSAPPIMNIGYYGEGATTARDAQEEFVHQLARRVPNLRGRRVLDAGCGVGGPAVLLAGHYGANVDAVNLVPEHVELAREYVLANDLADRVRPCAANAMLLPFTDGSFDVVFSLEAAHCFIDKTRFLAEVRRVLRPGGYLVMADITGTSHLPLVNWQPALALDLATAKDWQQMIGAEQLDLLECSLVGREVYPGFRRRIARTAPSRREAIRRRLAGDGGRAGPVIALRAWALELAFDRSVLPIGSWLGIRQYVLLVARKPG